MFNVSCNQVLMADESSNIHIPNLSKSTLLRFETSFSHIDILISVEATTRIFHSLRWCLPSGECSDTGNAPYPRNPKDCSNPRAPCTCFWHLSGKQMVLCPLGTNDNGYVSKTSYPPECQNSWLMDVASSPKYCGIQSFLTSHILQNVLPKPQTHGQSPVLRSTVASSESSASILPKTLQQCCWMIDPHTTRRKWLKSTTHLPLALGLPLLCQSPSPRCWVVAHVLVAWTWCWCPRTPISCGENWPQLRLFTWKKIYCDHFAAMALLWPVKSRVQFNSTIRYNQKWCAQFDTQSRHSCTSARGIWRTSGMCDLQLQAQTPIVKVTFHFCPQSMDQKVRCPKKRTCKNNTNHHHHNHHHHHHHNNNNNCWTPRHPLRHPGSRSTLWRLSRGGRAPPMAGRIPSLDATR